MDTPLVVAIIQARMASSRLPGKVLADIAGKPMALHVVERTGRAKHVDLVVLATTEQASDDRLAKLCARENIACFRGKEDDVLDRYYQAAKQYQAATIIRVTADCPVIDPDVIDTVVQAFQREGADYVSNVLPPTYPDGLDTEVFSFSTLERTWHEAKWLSEREHVTPYMRNPDRFQVKNVTHSEDLSHLRWTVDEPEDLEFMRSIFTVLEGKPFTMADVLEALQQHPDLQYINTDIVRNAGYHKSLRADKVVDS
jgi:spore coat polysaccharide biosynthesis protein SpsF (cytidylyltransferase family)